MAAADLAQWRQAVRRLLPAGAVYAQRDTARAVMDLWVAWREPAPGPSDDPDPAEAQWVPPGECPEGLGRGDDLGIRCVHLRIGL
jgi:type IV pilus assembly protein PilV